MHINTEKNQEERMNKSTFMLMREDEREARKQLIIRAARNLVDKRARLDIGMREIAAEAGISPGAIYRYFPSRDDLLVEAFIQDLVEILQHFDLDKKYTLTTMEDFAQYVIEHLIDHEDTFQMMSYVMISGKMSPQLVEKFNNVMRNFLAQFHPVLREAASDESVKLLAQAFFAALAGIVMTYRNFPGRKKEEVRRHMRRLAHLIAILFKHAAAKAAKAVKDFVPPE